MVFMSQVGRWYILIPFLFCNVSVIDFDFHIGYHKFTNDIEVVIYNNITEHISISVPSNYLCVYAHVHLSTSVLSYSYTSVKLVCHS